MNPDGKPQKGARKLTIEGETWWYYIGRGAINIPIWSPDGEKTIHKGDDVRSGLAITPFDLRVHIDRHLRGVPEEKIKAFIEAREARIAKEQAEYIDGLRKSVFARAKDLVEHSNSLFREYHGGDEVDIRNREENRQFLQDLLRIICHDKVQGTLRV